MAALVFPLTPLDNDLHYHEGRTWRYSAALNAWATVNAAIPPASRATVVANTSARLALSAADALSAVIVEEDTNRSYMLVEDGNPSVSGDWVRIGYRVITGADITDLSSYLDYYLPLIGGVMEGTLDMDGNTFVGLSLFADTGIFLTADMTGRSLYDSSELESVGWGDRVLKNAGGAVVVDWQNGIYGDSSFRWLDVSNFGFYHDNGTYTVKIVSYSDLKLTDDDGFDAVDWRNRLLQDSVGSTLLDFSNDLGGGVYIPLGNLTLGVAGTFGGYIYFNDVTNLFGASLQTTALTAERSLFLPDTDGTLAVTADLGSYLLLAGGVMAGGIDMGTNSIDNAGPIYATGYYSGTSISQARAEFPFGISANEDINTVSGYGFTTNDDAAYFPFGAIVNGLIDAGSNNIIVGTITRGSDVSQALNVDALQLTKFDGLTDTTALDWNLRQLIANNGTTNQLDWSSPGELLTEGIAIRTYGDGYFSNWDGVAHATSLDWVTRNLYDAAGTTIVMSWGGSKPDFPIGLTAQSVDATSYDIRAADGGFNNIRNYNGDGPPTFDYGLNIADTYGLYWPSVGSGAYIDANSAGLGYISMGNVDAVNINSPLFAMAGLDLNSQSIGSVGNIYAAGLTATDVYATYIADSAGTGAPVLSFGADFNSYSATGIDQVVCTNVDANSGYYSSAGAALFPAGATITNTGPEVTYLTDTYVSVSDGIGSDVTMASYYLSFGNSSFICNLYGPALTAFRDIYLPDADGTVALLSDIPDGSAYQPVDALLSSISALDFTGNALKLLRVNAGGTDFEFVTPTGGGDALVANTLDQFADVTQTAGQTLAITASTTLSGGTHSGTNTGDVSVTDSAEIDFTLTGQNLTAVLIAASIAASKLDAGVNASLSKADSAVQPSLASVAGLSFGIDEDTMASNSDTKFPTQQSVKAYVDTTVASAKAYQGGYDASTDTPSLDDGSPIAGIKAGFVYDVTVAGTFFSVDVEVGDSLTAKQDNPTTLAHWVITQTNLTAASIKTQYESNADTNAFTDAEQSKLSGIEAGADITDAANVAAAINGSTEITSLALDDKISATDTSATGAKGWFTVERIRDYIKTFIDTVSTTFTNKTLTNPTINAYTEGVVAIGNSGTSQTLDISAGTFQTVTLTGNCTFTMPTATAGKSFMVKVLTGAGGFTGTFTGVKWPGGITPTITATAGKYDLVSFVADGTSWSGNIIQNYTA